MESSLAETRKIGIHLEVTYRVGQPRLWLAITEELAAWWGAPYLLHDADATELHLEGWVGGRMYESWGLDSGGLWGQVTAWQAGKWFEVSGQFGLSTPSRSIVCFETEELASGSLLKLSHVIFGPVTDQVGEAYEKGWRDLLAVKLKQWVEEGVPGGLLKEKPE